MANLKAAGHNSKTGEKIETSMGGRFHSILISVNGAVRILWDPERPLPGMLGFFNKPVPTTLAKKQGELFVNLLLQFLWVGFPDLLEQMTQLLINVLLRLWE